MTQAQRPVIINIRNYYKYMYVTSHQEVAKTVFLALILLLFLKPTIT